MKTNLKNSINILAGLLLLLSSCSKEASGDSNPPQAETISSTIDAPKEPADTCIEHQVAVCFTDDKKPNIRVHNVSKYDYCNFRLDVGWGFVNYGNIPAGDSSCYRCFDRAWTGQSFDFTIKEELFSQSVLDRVGDKMMSAGNFTIKINIFNFARKGVDSNLRAD